jgi:hypothetical protein
MDFDLVEHRSGGILKLSLETPEPEYEFMGHIRLLPRNSEAMVDRAMELLGINDQQSLVLYTSRIPRAVPHRVKY